jgi:hypothetical protein
MPFKLVIPTLMFCVIFLYSYVRSGADEFFPEGNNEKETSSAVDILYGQLGESKLPYIALKSSLHVYNRLLKEGQIANSRVLTIIDFNRPSLQDRLFVIDLKSGKILYKSLVAHGKNSGENVATCFSNSLQSHQSSLGFYLTGESYVGRHGYSLILNGIEKGFNDNAKKRAIVIHGAIYVSYNFIESNGRLGRSFGCPALPVELAPEIIDAIKDKSLLFIYSSEENYCRNSALFNSVSSNL